MDTNLHFLRTLLGDMVTLSCVDQRIMLVHTRSQDHTIEVFQQDSKSDEESMANVLVQCIGEECFASESI